MFRLLVLGLLIFLTALEIKKQTKPVHLKLAFVFLTFMLVFRFGQGSDYFNYHHIYENVVSFREFGYTILQQIFRIPGLPYPVFVAFVAITGMALLYRFVTRYSQYRMFSLLMVFCIYYMTYYESTLRQCLALSVMLGLVLPFRDEKKWGEMIFSIILAASFHTSALVLFLLFLIKDVDEKKDVKFFNFLKTYSDYFVIIVLAFVTIIYLIDFRLITGLLPEFIRSRLASYITLKPSLFALLNRSIFLIVIYYLALGPRERMGRKNIFLLKVYFVGFLIYCVFFGIDIIASRLNVYFRIIEIALLPNLIYCNIREGFLIKRKIALCITVVFTCLVLLYAKECYNVMIQSGYHSPSYYNYPYVTIFRPGRLMSYRAPDVYGIVNRYAG